MISKEATRNQILKIIARSKIRYKNESSTQKLIGALLKPFNKKYLSGYATTMFGTIWLPSEEWYLSKFKYNPEGLYALLKHEEQHLKDEKRFNLFFWITFMFILPIGITMRAWWEWRAYKITLRCIKETLGAVPSYKREHVVNQFTSSKYLWMFPFKRFIRRRVDRFCQIMDLGDDL